MNKIQIKLLKKVLSIQSSKIDDSRLTKYITDFLSSIKIPYEKDEYGNIYAIKGSAENYPCVVAHVDTVHAIIENFQLFQSRNVLFGFDADTCKQYGVGGDDKVGVFIILQLLLDDNIKKLKAVFYKDEESGRWGSEDSIKNKKEFYNNCNYVLQCDRYGRHDFITSISGTKVSSDDFIADVEPLLAKYNYKENTGISTDVLSLHEGGVGISCCNISCGYFSHHTAHEVVNINDVQKTYLLVCDIVNNLDKKYPHKYIKTKVITTDYYSNYMIQVDQYMFKRKRKGFHDLKLTKAGTFLMLPKVYVCPVCKIKGDLFIDTSIDSCDIYCCQCRKYIPDQSKKIIYKTLVLYHNKSYRIKMVYSTALTSWIFQSTAIFNETIKSYIKRS